MAPGFSNLRKVVAPALVLAALFLAGASARTEDKKSVSRPVNPTPRKDAWWQKLHQSFLERAKQGPIDVLFLGDSITQGWGGSGKNVWKERYDPLKAANFGISGDQTQHVLWRLKEGKELEGVHAKAVVLMIGTNNMFSDTAPQIADGVSAIVHELRHQLPDAQILLLGIFPRGERAADPVRDKIESVNNKIAKLDDGKHVHYLNIGGKFLAENGNLTKDIMPDYLHLSEKGYKIWADAIQPSLDEMLKK
jgi:lysophospholipase L1-like esterase